MIWIRAAPRRHGLVLEHGHVPAQLTMSEAEVMSGEESSRLLLVEGRECGPLRVVEIEADGNLAALLAHDVARLGGDSCCTRAPVDQRPTSSRPTRVQNALQRRRLQIVRRRVSGWSCAPSPRPARICASRISVATMAARVPLEIWSCTSESWAPRWKLTVRGPPGRTSAPEASPPRRAPRRRHADSAMSSGPDRCGLSAV